LKCRIDRERRIYENVEQKRQKNKKKEKRKKLWRKYNTIINGKAQI
jgi:hypothetical protein